MTTYYESIGSGVPVVFLHPPNMGHVVFKYQRELASDFQVILYDIHGHGDSDKGSKPMTMANLAEDLLDLLDKLHIEKAVICGYSAGASIGQQFALTYPERVEGLVLIGGFSEVSTFLLKKEYQLGLSVLRANQQRFLCKVLAKSHGITKVDEGEILKNNLKADFDSAYQYYKKSMNYTCTHRLHELTMPILLLHGDRSVHIHPYIQIFLKHLPHAKFAMVSKSGHQLPTKHHHEINHVIRQFVSSFMVGTVST